MCFGYASMDDAGTNSAENW